MPTVPPSWRTFTETILLSKIATGKNPIINSQTTKIITLRHCLNFSKCPSALSFCSQHPATHQTSLIKSRQRNSRVPRYQIFLKALLGSSMCSLGERNLNYLFGNRGKVGFFPERNLCWLRTSIDCLIEKKVKYRISLCVQEKFRDQEDSRSSWWGDLQSQMMMFVRTHLQK